jgi:tetratricopeptide (TPR) repeat protein
VAATENNAVAEHNVAGVLLQRGNIDEAILHYQSALRATSRADTPNHLSPAIIENSLGNALVQKGDVDGAISQYRKALAIRPSFADARSNLAAMRFRKGDLTGAIGEYEKVVILPPEDNSSHQRLAEMLIKAHRPREAIVQYRRALELAPDSVETINSLAWTLARNPDSSLRRDAEALALAQRANNLSRGKDPFVLRTLAAALAGSGRPVEAAATAECALELAGNNQPLAKALLTDLGIYRGT